MAPKINTVFVYPPIPMRHLDWLAYYDNDEPNDNGSMAAGYGATEQEAIDDLLENHPRNDIATKLMAGFDAAIEALKRA